MQTIEATYKLKHEDYIKYNKIFLKSSVYRKLVILFLVVMFAYLCYGVYVEYQRSAYKLSADFFSSAGLLIVVIIVYAFLIWYVILGRQRISSKALRKSPVIDGVYNYKFTPEKFHSTNTKNGRIISETAMDWNLIAGANIFKEVILLRLGMGYYFVPVNAFSKAEDLEEFKQFIKSAIKKVKVFRK